MRAGCSVYGCLCHGHFSPASSLTCSSPRSSTSSPLRWDEETKHPAAASFVILRVAIALLVGMAILVVAETFVPSGSLPGPVYLARGLRRRLARSRRYSQMLGLSGGPHLTASAALYQFFGYCPLVIAILAPRSWWPSCDRARPERGQLGASRCRTRTPADQRSARCVVLETA